MQEPRLFVRPDLVARGVDRPDRDPDLDRARRGVYGAVADRPTGWDGPYLRTVHAAARTLRDGVVFSHESAAALLGLPVAGPWPDQVHLICERRSGGRSQLDVVRHCLGLDDVPIVMVGTLAVTSPARTAFDLALTRPFAHAVVVTDAVLRLYPDAAGELAGLVADFGTRRGYQRVRKVLAFASGLSGSVGESLSRVEMDRLGFEPPELQVEVVTDGRSEWGDFGWRRRRILGEFDGEVKYRLDRYRAGGSVEDVVIREKNRENRMRVEYPTIARWDSADLRAGRLEAILTRAGVPRRTRPWRT